MANGQKVICVTERAVFELTPAGMCLREVAPGINLQTDVLDRMGFAPVVPADVVTMPFMVGA